MAVCLALSAYCSATETAFSSANTTRLRTLAEKGSGNAALALKLPSPGTRVVTTMAKASTPASHFLPFFIDTTS